MKTSSWKRAIVLAAALLLTGPVQASAGMARMCDVSKSGTVTSYDATVVLRYVAGLRNFSSEQQMLADATGDGKVTAFDAVCILKYSKRMVMPGVHCGEMVPVE